MKGFLACVLAAAFVTGIFAGDPRLLSARACLPRLVELEHQHGSVLAGMAKVTSDLGWSWATAEALRGQVASDTINKDLLDGGPASLAFALYHHTWVFGILGVGALLMESNLAPPALVLSKIGFAGGDRTENVVTSSWMARAANAALTILDRQQPPFSADTVSITPEGSVAQVNREGMTLRAFDYGNFPASGIRIANRGNQPLRLSYEIEGIPARARLIPPCNGITDIGVRSSFQSIT